MTEEKQPRSTAKRRSPRRRLPGRLLALILLPLGIWLLPGMFLRYALPALSPFVGVCSALAQRAFGLSLLCSLPVLALVIWRRRWFCRNLCPVGLIVETCAKARPKTRFSYRRAPFLGQWLALLTFGGALAACPLFLALDPLALLAGAAGAAHFPVALPRLTYAAGFATLIALSLLFPLLWCERLCPLGGAQVLLANLKDAFQRRESTEQDSGALADAHFSRRGFAGLGLGLAASLIGRRLPGAAKRPLRPPGAIGETNLKAQCVRCGNCVRSCPAGIIQPDLRPRDATGLLTPTVQFSKDFCSPDCNRCGQNCPTGAIAALPLAEKNARKIGIASIDVSGCLLAEERECSACTMRCPYQAITEIFNRETYTVLPVIDEEKCNGCGQCVVVCPENVVVVTVDTPAADRQNRKKSNGAK